MQALSVVHRLQRWSLGPGSYLGLARSVEVLIGVSISGKLKAEGIRTSSAVLILLPRILVSTRLRCRLSTITYSWSSRPRGPCVKSQN